MHFLVLSRRDQCHYRQLLPGGGAGADRDHEKLSACYRRWKRSPWMCLQAGVPWNWETFPQYMDALDRKFGVNVGALMGHTAIRLYAMGEASQERAASEDELDLMRKVVRQGMDAGALGLSLSRNMSHFDVRGKLIPASFAPEPELFALAEHSANLAPESFKAAAARRRS